MNGITRVGQTDGCRDASPHTNNQHIVQRGDTLWGIARQHRVSLAQLDSANPQLARNDFIFPGDRIVIPTASRDPSRAEAANDPDRRTAPVTPTENAETPPARSTDIRAMFDPERGSAALGAVIIGQAEGTRTPTGGFRTGYYGHTDPGNGVSNRGSFSLQNAGTLSPTQADARQLARLSRQIPAFETAATAAGLDPNNPALATAYLDLYNQSPTAATRFVDQLDYLADNGISTESLVELRFRSFVDQSTGERFRLPSGAQAGGGFVNIARNNLGRQPTETEVQLVIRADQERRINAMAGALPDAETAPAANAEGAPAETGPARFTRNPGIDLTPNAVNRTNLLSNAVREQTGHALHVTSGRRTPERQAAAMFNNFADGSGASYRNREAFGEVRDAYDTGRAEGLNRAAIVERMTGVLQAQVDRGVFLSRHMSDRAIDIRLPPAGVRGEVLATIRDNPAVQSILTEDDHLHIQFR